MLLQVKDSLQSKQNITLTNSSHNRGSTVYYIQGTDINPTEYQKIFYTKKKFFFFENPIHLFEQWEKIEENFNSTFAGDDLKAYYNLKLDTDKK